MYQKRFYADQAAFDAGTVSETITMTHDAFGRELTTVWDRMATTPGLVVDIWANTWDEHGRLIHVDSPTGQIFYEYDTQGRQVRVATRPAGFTPQNDDDVSTDIRYTYDLLGRLSSVETWERNDVLVDVDAGTAGQQPETNSYVYDVVGNLDREIKPDGSTTDYTFDDLNRLTDIIAIRSDGTLLTDFDYTLRPDGKRDFAVEKIYNDDGSLASHTTFDWECDAAGRLTDEIFTNVDGLLFDIDDYHTSVEYDLTGNRLSKTTITDDDGTPGFDAASDTDEVVTYSQDANDRMTTEDRVVDGVAVDSTSYGYSGTQQTSKTVTPAGSVHSVSSVVYSYDLRQRMSQAITTATDSNTDIQSVGKSQCASGIPTSAE